MVRLVTPVGQGSGVVIDPRGFVLTANHVISGSTQVTVIFGDGRKETGLILGRDEFRDLAVVKISGREDLLAAPIGDSAALFAGDQVLAMGYTGDSLVVTRGIVSDRVVLGGLTFIQTDALLIPGFSGGPLFTPKGQVIGMSVQRLSVANSGGLAVALDSVATIIPRLMAGELFLSTPPPQAGASRQNPAPIGRTVNVNGFSIGGGTTLHEMTVLEVLRGDAAMAKLQEYSSFVIPPAPGEDYLVLKMKVKYVQGPEDETVRVSWVYFDLFSSQGFTYTPAFSVTPPDPLLAFDFLPGSTMDAWLVYALRADDARPLLAYGVNWSTRGKGWFAVSPAKTLAPPATPTPTPRPEPTPTPTPTP